MGICGSLRELAHFLEECEEMGWVDGVDIAGGTDGGEDGSLTADIDITLTTNDSDGGSRDVSIESASVDADGQLQFAAKSTAAVVPSSGHRVEVDVTKATVETDGTVSVTLEATIPTENEHRADGEGESEVGRRATGGVCPQGNYAPRDAEGTDESTSTGYDAEIPPFRNPELLTEVYESCETFAEMTDALGMDVTAETVRRYMIDYEIHEPQSYDTTLEGDADELSAGDDRQADEVETDDSQAAESDSDDERQPDPTAERQSANDDDDLRSPVVLADGIGLPDEVTVDAIVESVQTSDTVYEVMRDVGLDREDTLELLRELDLLDLVVGRLTTEAEREISRRTVVDHLRAQAEGR